MFTVGVIRNSTYYVNTILCKYSAIWKLDKLHNKTFHFVARYCVYESFFFCFVWAVKLFFSSTNKYSISTYVDEFAF